MTKTRQPSTIDLLEQHHDDDRYCHRAATALRIADQVRNEAELVLTDEKQTILKIDAGVWKAFMQTIFAVGQPVAPEETQEQ